MNHPFAGALAFVALAGVAAGCAGTPRVSGVPGTSPAPHVPWTPPADARTRAVPRVDTVAHASLPADLGARIRQLTLTDVVDVGLRNNPATRQAWASARAAAMAYGSTRGALLPTVDGNVTGTRLKTVASQGRLGVEQSVFNPSLSLSYLLFDFGGRSGAIGGARQALIAADFSHNAAIQDVVLQIQIAYFQYVATRALLDAQQSTLREAQTNLEAAEERRRAGVATVADVLQARTAAAQAELALQTTEGDLQTTRANLALSLGVPANLPYDIDSTAADVPVGVIADSVNTLIESALRARPDLDAARARYDAARSRVAEQRARRLPALELQATGGRTYTTTLPSGGNNYTVSLGLRVPLFAGFSREYDQQEAEALAEAAGAEADALRQRVVYEVFSSYYALQTATRRVRTSEVLLESAQQSSEVAAARYKSGVGSVLDLLSAQAALADARAQRVQARLAWSTSLAQLARDAGLLDAQGRPNLRFTPDSAPTPPR